MDKAARASRESPAPKRKNDNEDLEEDENFGRFVRSRTVSIESGAVTGLPRSAAADVATGLSRPADDDDFEAQMQDIDSMELVDRKIIAASIFEVDIT